MNLETKNIYSQPPFPRKKYNTILQQRNAFFFSGKIFKRSSLKLNFTRQPLLGYLYYYIKIYYIQTDFTISIVKETFGFKTKIV